MPAVPMTTLKLTAAERALADAIASHLSRTGAKHSRADAIRVAITDYAQRNSIAPNGIGPPEVSGRKSKKSVKSS